MTELKTLKDLDGWTDEWKDVVKAEAMKWVKEKGKQLNLMDWLEFFDIEVMGMALAEGDLK